MAPQAVIDRLTKLGEQTVSQAAEALSKNKALQGKLETVVKSGLASKMRSKATSKSSSTGSTSRTPSISTGSRAEEHRVGHRGFAR